MPAALASSSAAATGDEGSRPRCQRPARRGQSVSSSHVACGECRARLGNALETQLSSPPGRGQGGGSRLTRHLGIFGFFSPRRRRRRRGGKMAGWLLPQRHHTERHATRVAPLSREPPRPGLSALSQLVIHVLSFFTPWRAPRKRFPTGIPNETDFQGELLSGGAAQGLKLENVGLPRRERRSGLHWAPLGSIGLHRAPSGSIGLPWAPLGSLGLHWAPSGSTWSPDRSHSHSHSHCVTRRLRDVCVT